MDTFRKEMARLATICYSIILFLYVVLRVNAFATTGTIVSESIIGLSLLGMVFAFMFFIGFLWEFVVESVKYHHISSLWTWLMHFPSFQRAFVTSEYVGFRRLCVLIIGACITTYVIPSFYQKGIMALPAFSLIMSSVFIVLGFVTFRKKDINEH